MRPYEVTVLQVRKSWFNQKIELSDNLNCLLNFKKFWLIHDIDMLKGSQNDNGCNP